MLLPLIRLSTQHRTLYCYMILSIWIFLLIAGMYKYMGNNFENPNLLAGGSAQSIGFGTADDASTSKFKKYRARCAPFAQLMRVDDGGILEGWKLQGVLLVIRHGDRGPMSHLRTPLGGGINCGVTANNLVNRYHSFLQNSSTSSSGANHMYWNKLGPFHGFALLPATEHACMLGQLTYKGIAQLLHVGEILHQIYAHPLGLLLKQSTNKAAGYSSTPHTLLNSDEVVVYTTRYRRTFQSALALLYTFLPVEKWLALNIRESHSMAFCFTDCACPKADKLRHRLNVIAERQLLKRPDVLSVMQWIGGTLLEYTPNGIKNPNEVVDALLTVLCHDAPLPCRRVDNGSVQSTASSRKNIAAELGDLINIDQDDVPTNIVDNGDTAPVQNGENVVGYEGTVVKGCVETAHVESLMSFHNTVSMREVKHDYYKRIGLMRAYGMVRHIVSHMLKMISGDRTKFVLYSGHDWTLQYLTAALGISTPDTFISYAARLGFEVYRSEAHTDYYFRVVLNGQDVTQQIDFCEGGRSLRVTRDSRGNKADLCPIENIIRFLHEDYFAPLNATNFKDACSANIPRPNEF